MTCAEFTLDEMLDALDMIADELLVALDIIPGSNAQLADSPAHLSRVVMKPDIRYNHMRYNIL